MSTRIALTSSAKEITQVRRAVRVEGAVLLYDLWMAAVGIRLSYHLNATLRKE